MYLRLFLFFSVLSTKERERERTEKESVERENRERESIERTEKVCTERVRERERDVNLCAWGSLIILRVFSKSSFYSIGVFLWTKCATMLSEA